MLWIPTQLPISPAIIRLSQELGTQSAFPEPLANILYQRGITTKEAAKAFFVPEKTGLHDPFLMKNMQTAVERIWKAKQAGEKILIYGDYDVDGTTSVTLMSLFLSDWGFDYEYYIPDRYKEGYGISFKGIEYAASIGASLIISLDCGIKANDKVRYAKQLHIDFIICDHHTPDKELPEAVAVLDTLQPGCAYPCKHLTGCGVGLKLAQALTQYLQAQGLPLPRAGYDPFEEYCDFVALSIACDIVPIVDENRVITYWGLQKMRTNPAPGIAAIQQLAEGERKWDVNDLVFFIGPRINSAGRLTQAKEAVEVLLGKSEILSRLANELHDANDERRNIDAEITLDALQLISQDSTYPQKHTTVLYKESWHKGVIGIVASRLIEKHYRPTILFTKSEEKLVGSARSVQGFDLYAALEECADLMVQFGGHKYAAGMTLKEEQFAAFAQKFDAVVSQRISESSKYPAIFVDYFLGFADINEKFIRLLQRMEPFGPENLEPVFVTEQVRIKDYNVLKDVHIRLVLEHQNVVLNAIAFNMADKFVPLTTEWIDIAYHVGFNTWNGKQFVQLQLKDVKFRG